VRLEPALTSTEEHRTDTNLLAALSDLPQASIATHSVVLHFMDPHTLFGRGIGLVDIHLLAAVRLTPGTSLWTNDKRLHGVAGGLRLAALLS